MARPHSQNDLVESDLADIYDYIAEDSPFYGQQVLNAIYDTLLKIARDPEIFPPYTSPGISNPNLRRAVCLPYRNFLVFYELTAPECRVLYVHHAAQDFAKRHREENRG